MFARLILISLLLSATLYAAPGDIDTSFGNEGIVSTEIISSDVSIDTKGRIVIAGFLQDDVEKCALARFNKNGNIDENFGTNGIVSINFSDKNCKLYSVISDKNKIIAGGFVGKDFILIKLNENGSVDTDFGMDGIVVTNVSGNSESDVIYDIALQSDGKIVAAGFSNNDYALVRYSKTGSLDFSFGNNGIVKNKFKENDTTYNSIINSIDIQSDGKIIVGGNATVTIPSFGTFTYFALSKLNSDGTIDTNFGIDGTIITHFPDENFLSKNKINLDFPTISNAVHKVLIQPDSNILAAGFNNDKIAIVRYKNNGSIDKTFGNNGFVIKDFDKNLDLVKDMTLQDDGKIIVGGSSNNNFLIMRFNSDGQLDAQSIHLLNKTAMSEIFGKTFGENGYYISDIDNSTTGKSEINAISLQRDGKIITVGPVQSNNFQGNSAIVRYIGDALKLPTSKLSYNYDYSYPASASIFDYKLCTPISVEINNDNLTLSIITPDFEYPVDMYFALQVPEYSSEIYLFTQDGNLQPLSKGLIAWETETTADIEKTIVRNVDLNKLPKGHYNLYFAVVPTGMNPITAYYLWSTNFEN
jgi:uncharacterized delta-60 repeat protein